MMNQKHTWTQFVIVFMLTFLLGACAKKAETPEEAAPTAETEASSEAPQSEATPTTDPKASRPSPPATATGKAGAVDIKIDYSQPSVKGRTVFGNLAPYDELWRTGANEATVFEVSENVLIEGDPLPAGKYALFTIPKAEEPWVVIFNKTYELWGKNGYEESEDALRIEVSPKETEHTEKMEFGVDNGVVTLKWATTAVSFEVEADSGSDEGSNEG